MTSGPNVIPIEYVAECAARLATVANRPWFVFLDSCVGRAIGGRYDVISADPRVTLTTRGNNTQIVTSESEVNSTADPFMLIKKALSEHRCESHELPFIGGAIGYFGYDLGRRIEILPDFTIQDIDIPDMAVGIYDWAAVFDHQSKRAWLVAEDDCVQDLGYWEKILTAASPLTPAAYGTSFQTISEVKPEISFSEYSAAFRQIKKYIVEGDCYQVNFAQRFSADVSGNAWDAYQRLRNLNPAPYSSYISIPGGAILSSSPERFLRVADRAVESKPIKGTRRRARDPVEDRRLAEELAESEKDRAENIMIVDLLRNDLGKSCAVGSVEVPQLFAVESYTTVHHLVSTIRGRLADELEATDLLRGCFPGGSITGAPKLRAMEIIEELEPFRRTVYCGSIGYLSCDGKMDTNIAIRTLVHCAGKMYCWAGGGIVADSELDEEYRESLDKAAAMLDVFSHAEAQHLGH